MNFKTEQEEFWYGKFGNEYIDRNNGAKIIAGNLALFSKIFSSTKDINSVIEFGSNIGLNLEAIKQLLPDAKLSAIEINEKAASILKENIKNITIYNQSILNFKENNKHNFVLIKGVLIHINPNELDSVYEKLYNSSDKYICICEYYNPTPVTIDYRGNQDKLFKRDFAGEFMNKYKDVKLIDYGFLYHKDNNFYYDDSTWFLMKK